ncbi:hypothetical protein [Pseudonocardia lacus]|uniref:hypothetical protein n=1 Tax=Pseudonocardia lacus TaxID=2835865 RepID=UPI001BDC51BD|nr:hypothetical protein [Pseudonocardia lacus]
MTDLTEAARIVAGWPRVLTRLLDTHVPGPDGRCRGCTSQVSLPPRWPCALTEFARLAAATPGHRPGHPS